MCLLFVCFVVLVCLGIPTGICEIYLVVVLLLRVIGGKDYQVDTNQRHFSSREILLPDTWYDFCPQTISNNNCRSRATYTPGAYQVPGT